ncbi:hypothetical protein ABGB16_31825 [Micromonospora sp. B11E3]|uniref:hypothetical protein n=1 Tax=Micromonospora sp. B11E3 TaxID=3153562 RepID=UPI00325D35A6
MKRLRVASTVLICASLLALAACGGEDTETTAGRAPSASSAPATSSAPSPSAAVATKSDKELCESAKKVGAEMKAKLVAAVQSGDSSPATFRKVLTGLSEKVTEVASAGGDGKVTTAMKQFAAEAAKAAGAADPATAADNPALTKAGADLSAACKAVGVSATF